jgi:hypothetical protein
VTTTTDVMQLVKEYREKSGDHTIAAHVVCRVLASMPGVTKQRPTTAEGRRSCGTVYFGVCINSPHKMIRSAVVSALSKAGMKAPPPSLVVDPYRVVSGKGGKPVRRKAKPGKRGRKKKRTT